MASLGTSSKKQKGLMSEFSKIMDFEVILVDDDKVAMLMQKNQLLRCNIGYLPVLCSNGKKALEYLQKNDAPKKNFLVLLDLNMPVLNGWEFLESLKKDILKANIHVVIVTSSVFKGDYKRAMEFEHVVGFCSKPLSRQDIQEIKNLKQLRPYFSNNFAVKNASEK